MKSKMNKYMTRGAMVACTAVLFSCEGDDGAPGAPGASGAVKDLPVAAPKVTQLPLSEIDAVVDQVNEKIAPKWLAGNSAVARGDEFNINFLSEVFAEIQEPGGTNWQSQIDYDITGEKTFSVTYTRNGIIDLTVNFDVKASEDYTLVGTFTSEGVERRDLDINADPAKKLTPDAGTGLTDLSKGGGTTALTLDKASFEYDVKDGEVVAGWDPNPNNGDAQDGLVFIKKIGASTDAALRASKAAEIALEAKGQNNVVVSKKNIVSGVVSDKWTQVVHVGTDVPDAFSGTFRLDMNPSQGGVSEIDNDGLIKEDVNNPNLPVVLK